MTNVTVTVVTSSSTSIASLRVTWIKNGGPALIKIHPISFPGWTVYYNYLDDTGGTLVGGDTVSVTVAELDSLGNASPSVASVPVSLTIPVTPPLPPTSVTIALN